jgi:hypothetical protein
MIWAVIAVIAAFGVGFYLGMKLGVWATMDVLADKPTAWRSEAFTKWIAKRQKRSAA